MNGGLLSAKVIVIQPQQNADGSWSLDIFDKADEKSEPFAAISRVCGTKEAAQLAIPDEIDALACLFARNGQPRPRFEVRRAGAYPA